MANETRYGDQLTLDEIVFENRNKEYGAYDLRHSYPKILTRAFLIGTLLFLVVAITPFVVMKIKELTAEKELAVDANLMDIVQEDQILDQPQEEEPPPPPPPKEEEPIEVIQNVVPEPKKAPKIETPPPPIDAQLDTRTGLENVEGKKEAAYVPPPPPPAPPGKGNAVETKPAVNPNEIYANVDQAAEYPGGMGALRKFLGEQVDTSLFDGDEGKLTANVKFVVERDGTVSDVKVVGKSGNRDFDDEAIRAVKKLKKWKPAKLNGELVRSYYSVPFVMTFEY